MQKARILGGLAALIVVLLCAVLLAVWLLVNPNNFKGMIAVAVKESLGRDLQLSGDIKLSVFPTVALAVGPARLGNPPGYGDEPFLSFAHAALRVKLLPLLRRRLEVSRVDIDGLDLRLRKNAAGQGNWVAPSPESSAHADETGRGRSLDSPPAVHIRRGRVSYQDIVVENFNLESGSAVRDIPMRITFDAHRSVPGEHMTVNAKFDVSAESGAQAIRLADVNLSGTLSRSGEDSPAQWSFSAPSLVVDPSQQSVQADFKFSYANAHLSGSVTATKIFDELSMTGSLTLAPLGLHEFIPRLGMGTPKTNDPEAWSQLSGNTDFAYASKVWSLKKLHARLDDTELQGNIKFSPSDADTLTFDLAADQIDLDRYRAPKGSAAAGRDAKIAVQSSNPAKNPIDWDGTLAAARMSFTGMDFTDLRLTASSKGGVTHVFPIEAQIDGGRFSGDITLDDRGAVRVISIDEHLAKVDMARLLAKSAQKGRLSGRATLNLNGNARGGSMAELLKSFNGHLDADLSDGAIEGVDLEYERDLAQALIDRTAPPRADTKRTRFDAFKTSAQITNGIAETQDLTISTQALRVLGKGSVNLSTKGIDFQLLASILKAPTKTLADVPLKVTGTYADPAVKADIESLAKDQLKQKLKDILKKNGLQGLFGK